MQKDILKPKLIINMVIILIAVFMLLKPEAFTLKVPLIWIELARASAADVDTLQQQYIGAHREADEIHQEIELAQTQAPEKLDSLYAVLRVKDSIVLSLQSRLDSAHQIAQMRLQDLDSAVERNKRLEKRNQEHLAEIDELTKALYLQQQELYELYKPTLRASYITKKGNRWLIDPENALCLKVAREVRFEVENDFTHQHASYEPPRMELELRKGNYSSSHSFIESWTLELRRNSNKWHALLSIDDLNAGKDKKAVNDNYYLILRDTESGKVISRMQFRTNRKC